MKEKEKELTMTETQRTKSSMFAKTSVLPCMLALLWLTSFNGHAQEVASDADQGQSSAGGLALEEVMVMARKRVEPLQETPVAATVLTGQDYQLRFLNDLKTLELPAPNVTISQIDYFSNAVSVSIRGIVNTDIESSFDPPVGIFVDGVYIPRPATSSLDLFDVAQIEILRGPQGTIFGRNTSAGAVQVRSRRPSGEFGGRASITAGQYGRLDLKAAVDIPIIDGKVDAKIAALSQSMDGYYTSSINGRDLGEEDISAIRPMIRFTPSDEFDLTLIGEYSRNKSQLMPGQNDSAATDLLCVLQGFCGSDNPLGQIDEFKVPQDDSGAGFIDAEIWGITAEMNWDIGAGVITSVSNYRDTEEFIDIDGEHLTTDFFQISRDGEHDQFSTELRFASTAWDSFDFIAGVYYFEQEYAQESNLFLGIGPIGTTFGLQLVGNANQKHESYSLFGEGNYHFNDKLTVTFGGRWSEDKKTFTNELFGVSPTPGTRFTPDSESWSDFGPKLGITYQWNPDLMTYFTYSRGYKSGGFNGRCQTEFTCGRTFDPEQVDGFEAGLKGDFLDGRLRANLALFLNEYEDLQRTAIVPQPGVAIANETVTVNSASAELSGIELELSAFVTEGLRVDFSVGFLDASYDEFCVDLDGPSPSDSVPTSSCGEVFFTGVVDGKDYYAVEEDLSALDLQRAPELTFSANINYEFAFKEAGKIVLNGRYSFADSQFTDQLESSLRSESNLLDASISFVDMQDRYRVSLFGLNLTDDMYVTARNVAGGLWTTRFVNPPRRWGVEVAVNF